MWNHEPQPCSNLVQHTDWVREASWDVRSYHVSEFDECSSSRCDYQSDSSKKGVRILELMNLGVAGIKLSKLVRKTSKILLLPQTKSTM